MAGEQHQVVSHSGGVVGKRELQLELVEEAEAGDGGIGHKGRVTKLIAATESGTGDVDGCRRREETHLFHARVENGTFCCADSVAGDNLV